MANLKKSFTQVKRNGGASGVDGQSISDFGGNLSIELSHLQDELVGKTYQPQAVKREPTIPWYTYRTRSSSTAMFAKCATANL